MANGKGKIKKRCRRRCASACTFAFCLPAFAFMFSSGCADKKKDASIRDRQDKALHDPFKYSAYSEEPDVSGGDIGHYDKDAMKEDLDNVLNP